MTRRLILAAAALFFLGGCDKLTPQKTDSSVAASDAASSFVPPARIEDLEYLSDEDRKAEAAAIAAHTDRVRRDNFLLTLFHEGHPIASFEDRFDCFDICPIWLYAGTYRLIDPATGKPAIYDHVTVSYDEDSDDYLVDHDGQVYYLTGADQPLISPSLRYAAASDLNVNGDGRISLLDWPRKTTFQVLPTKAIKGARNSCAPLAWTADDHLRALCGLRDGVFSGVDIARQPDGRWQVREQETFAEADVESDGDTEGLKLKPGAKATKVQDGVVFYAEPRDQPKGLSGYKQLTGS
jgi:hypothetical protein